MPIEIVRNDITSMHVDAIVNLTCSYPQIGLGIDSYIHEKAGPELLAARSYYHIRIGQACATPAFQLPASFVIHAVVPMWNDGSHNEELMLQSCYKQSLRLALRRQCDSIAFPLSAINNYGFPKDKALQIAISAFSEFLLEHEMMIYLVVFDDRTPKLSEKLFHNIADYIEDHYVDPREKTTYVAEKQRAPRKTRRFRILDLFQRKTTHEDMAPCGETAVPRAASLSDYLKQEDAGFTETLLKMIDKTGRKDSEIYKRANLSKQHFSKIRNNLDYKPNKQTAIALALALELNLEQTKDLISRAGYTLSNSSKFDLIIRYFIEQKNYNIVEINMALYEFDQSLLGG